MKRRFLFLAILIITIAIPMVWAAGGSESGEASSTGLKPYELIWYMRGRGAEQDQALVEAKANEYLKDKINATIKIMNLDRGAYPNRMPAIVASGEAFDMCFTASWVLNYAQYAQRGAFLALNDPANNLQEKYLQKTVELLGEFYYGGSVIDGLHYAIPVNKEWAHSYGFEVRKDIMEKYNMDLSKVTKYEQMEPFFQIIKDNEPSMIPDMAYANNSPLAFLDWDYPAGQRVPVVMYSTGSDLKF